MGSNFLFHTHTRSLPSLVFLSNLADNAFLARADVDPSSPGPSTPPSASNALGLNAHPTSNDSHSPAPTYETLPTSSPPSPTLAPTYSNTNSGGHGPATSEKKLVSQVSEGTIASPDHLNRHTEASPTGKPLNADEQAFEKETGKDAREVENQEERFQQELASEENDGQVDLGPFAIKPKRLASLVDPYVPHSFSLSSPYS